MLKEFSYKDIQRRRNGRRILNYRKRFEMGGRPARPTVLTEPQASKEIGKHIKDMIQQDIFPMDALPGITLGDWADWVEGF